MSGRVVTYRAIAEAKRALGQPVQEVSWVRELMKELDEYLDDDPSRIGSESGDLYVRRTTRGEREWFIRVTSPDGARLAGT